MGGADPDNAEPANLSRCKRPALLVDYYGFLSPGAVRNEWPAYKRTPVIQPVPDFEFDQSIPDDLDL